MDTNEVMEARLTAILEQGRESMGLTPQYLHHQQPMFQGDWHGYNMYPNQYSSNWESQLSILWESQGHWRQQQSQISRVEDSSNDLVSSYIKSADVGMRNMHAVQKSQLASLHNMENQIGELMRIINENPIGGLLYNSKEKLDKNAKVVTLRSEKELVETPPTIDRRTLPSTVGHLTVSGKVMRGENPPRQKPTANGRFDLPSAVGSASSCMLKSISKGRHGSHYIKPHFVELMYKVYI
ncbi:hypothetical protein M9H77_30037 [Catharanthus roseus]|uniref:Uncharacterized protein n=1 Tax=Catharanthus roseus TaxID=4058 RepID=A0ACB9ZY01_CATRO|nr:hypothetical protein M9H77_30037 [Catharanthus roseus]